MIDLHPIAEEPNHAAIYEGREEFLIVLLIDSKIENFALLATSLGVDELLLKIQSFLASHNFHQIPFGINCQRLLRSVFFPFKMGSRSFQVTNNGTNSM